MRPPGILRPVFFSGDVNRRLRGRAVRRKPDLAQVLLHAGLHGMSDLVQHARRLVHPEAVTAPHSRWRRVATVPRMHVRFDERRLETELWRELRDRQGRKPPANSTASQPTVTAPVVDSTGALAAGPWYRSLRHSRDEHRRLT